jgi:hypothetical protein
VFDDPLIPPDMLGGPPPSGGKLDAQLVGAMLGAVSTGIELIRLKRELSIEITDDDVNDLTYLQRAAVTRIRVDQARRQKKARDLKERREAADELNRKPVVEEEDDDLEFPPF